MKHVNEIIIYEEEKIYEGNSTVFKGKFGFQNVAVKRMVCSNADEEAGEDALKIMNHPNVVKLLCVEQEKDLR